MTKKNGRAVVERSISKLESVLHPDLIECLLNSIDGAYDDSGNFDATKYEILVKKCHEEKNPNRSATAVAILLVGVAIAVTIIIDSVSDP